MITVRRATPEDAAAIGAVHVATWRSTYPGILPDAYLAELSAVRQAAHYEWAIHAQGGVFVAAVSGTDLGVGRQARVVGFTTSGAARSAGLAEGEIETLYVLDDWRERGLGRRLMRAAGQHLKSIGCRSVFLWVLSDNPSRWFYRRLGGRAIMQATISVGGRRVEQTAFVWDPIERLLATSTAAR